MDHIISRLAKELNLNASQIQATVALIDEGNTVPFIARYRKEATGGLRRRPAPGAVGTTFILAQFRTTQRRSVPAFDRNGPANTGNRAPA